MSWIRNPVYIITSHNQIQCMGDCKEGCVFSESKIWFKNIDNLNKKEIAKEVIKHLNLHYKHYIEKGDFINANLVEQSMRDIYLSHIPNFIFRWFYKKYKIKFLFAYDTD